MQNPRLYIRVDGIVPSTHSLLGYRIPFVYSSVIKLVSKFTEGMDWKTIQIKIVPSLVADRTKVIIMSTEFKHMEAPIEHSVLLLDEKTKGLVFSAETLEELFNKIENKT